MHVLFGLFEPFSGAHVTCELEKRNVKSYSSLFWMWLCEKAELCLQLHWRRCVIFTICGFQNGWLSTRNRFPGFHIWLGQSHCNSECHLLLFLLVMVWRGCVNSRYTVTLSSTEWPPMVVTHRLTPWWFCNVQSLFIYILLTCHWSVRFCSYLHTGQYIFVHTYKLVSTIIVHTYTA